MSLTGSLLRSRRVSPESLSRLGGIAAGVVQKAGGWEGIRGSFAEWTTTNPPMPDPIPRPIPSRRPGEIAGTTLAPGRARGVVRRPPAGSPGSILVCVRLDSIPEGSLATVAGIVVEVGAASARGARAARLAGVPVVLVAGALDRFPEGTPLTVDGDRAIVSPAPSAGTAL